MTKQDYDRLKAKEAQIEALIAEKKQIEGGKIISLHIRVFSDDKNIYEDIDFKNLPKGEIKKILLENIEGRLENAQNDYESYFDGETIFSGSNVS